MTTKERAALEALARVMREHDIQIFIGNEFSLEAQVNGGPTIVFQGPELSHKGIEEMI